MVLIWREIPPLTSCYPPWHEMLTSVISTEEIARPEAYHSPLEFWEMSIVKCRLYFTIVYIWKKNKIAISAAASLGPMCTQSHWRFHKKWSLNVAPALGSAYRLCIGHWKATCSWTAHCSAQAAGYPALFAFQYLPSELSSSEKSRNKHMLISYFLMIFDWKLYSAWTLCRAGSTSDMQTVRSYC